MSIARSMTIALSAAAFGTTLLTGVNAYAENHPATHRVRSHAAPSMKTRQRVASGRTTPGVGWVSYNNNLGLYIDVDTSSAHFTGNPVYVTSIGGNDNQWELTGTNAIYTPTATGFRLYVRWRDGHPITPADAQAGQWYVHWIGVDNP